ncbi:MAG: SAF domain-containing protein [Acidimicrobiia bacterium]
MALTDSATRRTETEAPPPAPGRSLLSRLSIGHLVMILAGLVAILLNLAFLRSSADQIEVAIAAASIPAGTTLSEATLTTVAIADAGDLAPGLITGADVSSLYGSVAARPLAAGEPVRRSDLRPPGTGSIMREFSLELDAAQAAGGRITARDVVDVIATVDTHSFYVAAGVEVISVTGESSAVDVGDDLLIVLSLDDRTALEISSAQAAGSISLVRSTGADPPRSRTVTVDPADVGP